MVLLSHLILMERKYSNVLPNTEPDKILVSLVLPEDSISTKVMQELASQATSKIYCRNPYNYSKLNQHLLGIQS